MKTSFFVLILNLVHSDSHRTYFLKFVDYKEVSSDLLQNKFSKLSIDQLDFEFFESLKQRLFCPIKNQSSKSERYEKPPGKEIQIKGSKGIISALRNKKLDSVVVTNSYLCPSLPPEKSYNW